MDVPCSVSDQLLQLRTTCMIALLMGEWGYTLYYAPPGGGPYQSVTA